MKRYATVLLSAVLLWGTPAMPVLAETEPETTDETTQIRDEMLETEEGPADKSEEENTEPEAQKSETETDADSAVVTAADEQPQNDSEPQDPAAESEQLNEGTDTDTVTDTAEVQPAAESDSTETAEEDIIGEVNPDDYQLSLSDEFSVAEEELLNADPVPNEEETGLWLGAKKAVPDNYNNILGEVNPKNGKPTASFDPKSNTLTLNEPNIRSFDNTGNAGIYAVGMNLKIQGTATIRIPEAHIGIWVKNGNLTIDGKDTVLDVEGTWFGISNFSKNSEKPVLTIEDATVKSTTPSESQQENTGAGIFCVDGVFRNSTVTSVGSVAGLVALNGLTMSGGYLHAKSISENIKQNFGLIAFGGILELSDDMKITKPAAGAIKTYGDQDDVPAKYIAVSENDETIAYDVTIAQQVQATFNANYTGSASPAVQKAFFGDETTLKPNTFTRTGYTFSGWNTKADGTGTAYADKASVKFTGNLDLYAQWKAINYSVTYNLDGGTVTKANPTTYNADTADFTLNNPTKNGYEFLGWTGSNGKTAQKTVTVKKGSTGNLSYTANWKQTPTPEPTAKPAPTPEPTAKPAPAPEPTAKPAPAPSTDPSACKAFGFCHIYGKDYWYENSVRQGTVNDPKGVIGDGTNRGREIYDPESDAWYWLDSVYEGAKAGGKEVWIPYVYQDEDQWSNDPGKLNAIAGESATYTEAPDGTTADMVAQVKDAILRKKGKWVRYDGNGKMMKGWVKIENGLEKYYPDQAGKTYYYDYKTGMMAKGWTKINGKFYFFDEITGELLG